MNSKERIICKANPSLISMNPLAIMCFIIAFLGFISSFIVATIIKSYRYTATEWITQNFSLYVWFYIGAVLFAGLGVLLMFLLKPALTVTDKRVYGKIGTLKKVDLPINQISAIGSGIFKSITVSTSSGSIHFWGITNRDDVLNEVSQLLAENQSSSNIQTTIVESSSNADELKKYKELLDQGIITQEEFDAKKKQLLGL